MKSYLLTLLLALLVVLAAVTLRRSMAGLVGPDSSAPNKIAIGVSPVPLPPTIAIGVSPVPLPPTARLSSRTR